MPKTIVLTNKQKIEINLMRHNHFYFHTVRINGRSRFQAERIDRDRALEIYQNNQDAEETYVSGRVDFDPERPCEWTWTAERIEEVDEEMPA